LKSFSASLSTILTLFIKSKPKTITHNNLVEPILAVIFPMGAEPESQEEESSDSEYDISAHKVRKSDGFLYTFIKLISCS
jgi:hypothetical protein